MQRSPPRFAHWCQLWALYLSVCVAHFTGQWTCSCYAVARRDKWSNIHCACQVRCWFCHLSTSSLQKDSLYSESQRFLSCSSSAHTFVEQSCTGSAWHGASKDVLYLWNLHARTLTPTSSVNTHALLLHIILPWSIIFLNRRAASICLVNSCGPERKCMIIPPQCRASTRCSP